MGLYGCALRAAPSELSDSAWKLVGEEAATFLGCWCGHVCSVFPPYTPCRVPAAWAHRWSGTFLVAAQRTFVASVSGLSDAEICSAGDPIALHDFGGDTRWLQAAGRMPPRPA